MLKSSKVKFHDVCNILSNDTAVCDFICKERSVGEILRIRVKGWLKGIHFAILLTSV